MVVAIDWPIATSAGRISAVEWYRSRARLLGHCDTGRNAVTVRVSILIAYGLLAPRTRALTLIASPYGKRHEAGQQWPRHRFRRLYKVTTSGYGLGICVLTQ
jgi:hypothetical protein